MTPPIEILVHISGPSRGPDDARYRKEAQGLLGAEPAKRLDLLPLQRQSDDVSERPLEQEATKSQRRTPVGKPTGPPGDLPSSLLERFENTTPYGATASCVKNGIFTVPRVPILKESRVDAAGSLIATKSTPQLHVAWTPVPPRQVARSTAIAHPEAETSARRPKSSPWTTPPSVIPDSQPIRSTIDGPEDSSSPCLKRGFSRIPPSPTKQNSEPHIRKRRRVQGTPRGTLVEGTGADEDRPSLFSPYEHIVNTASPPISHEGLPLSIHPPRPRPSAAQFTTHLTPPLQWLSTRLTLAKHYKVSFQARSLDKLERGHWYVQSQSWDEALKAKFRHYLTAYISKGRAGWGVWYSREYKSNDLDTGSSKENKDPQAMIEIVKVYCWGEVVREIWLLLWLASAGRVMKTRARWIDAQSETVLEMS